MDNEIYRSIINKENSGKQVKFILRDKLGLSNRIISNIKNNKGIIVNNNIVNINYVLSENDHLLILANDQSSENIIPQEMNFNIIFEDDCLLAINKQPGLVVHPTSYNFTGTLANGVMYYYKQNGINAKFRPVNRLDKDTSGIILIAKTQVAHYELSKQQQSAAFKKEYIAIVKNSFDSIKDAINLPIKRKAESIIERIVSHDGQNAVTEYEVISQNNKSALVRINLITGRTHQIRVHFSYIGHPLYGDGLYGEKDDVINRQALHCLQIQFVHPIKNVHMCLKAPIPQDMKNAIKILNLDNLL